MTGRYFQDWLLLPSDWNWRLRPDRGGALRAVGDIGSHWLDLMTFVTGQRIVEVMADLATFIPVREEPTGPVETFSTDRAAETVTRQIQTEDAATILLRFENGARGAMSVSQISPGRKNSLVWEVDGSEGALAWDSENPDQIWQGHRERPNEILIKNPALMGAAGQAAAALPGGHVEGLRGHVRGAVPGDPRRRRARAAVGATRLPDLRRRPRRDARQRRDRGERADRPLGGRRREPAAWGSTMTVIPPRDRRHDDELGLLTAPFPETPLMEVADWTAANGFESLEIACWPRSTGPTRRYAGTSHIDVAEPDGERRAARSSTRSPARGCRSPASATTRIRSHPDLEHRAHGHRPPQDGHRGGRADGRPARQHLLGGDAGQARRRQLGGGAQGLARHRRLRAATTASS